MSTITHKGVEYDEADLQAGRGTPTYPPQDSCFECDGAGIATFKRQGTIYCFCRYDLYVMTGGVKK